MKRAVAERFVSRTGVEVNERRGRVVCHLHKGDHLKKEMK